LSGEAASDDRDASRRAGAPLQFFSFFFERTRLMWPRVPDQILSACDKSIQNRHVSVHATVGGTIESMVEDGLEESAAFVIGFDELLFEPIAQVH
jgi:hypothetical protein